MVLPSVIVYLILNGVTTAAKIKGNFLCTKRPEDPVCSRNALPAVKNGSFECNSNNNKMSSLRIGDVCSLKCDKGFYRTLSNHTICERGSHDQEGHWSDGIFECHECSDCVEWNGSLYTFINTAQSYENSRMMCQHKSNDTHLVYIESEEENDFVTRMLATFGTRVTAWTGLSDEKSEGNWTWGNHSAEYFNWDQENAFWEPNGGRDENNVIINFVHGTSDGKWYDVPPGWIAPAVCEKKLYPR